MSLTADSPPIDRNLDSLHPAFSAVLVAWLNHVSGILTQVEFRVTETRRTEERQRWLYAQGRTPPFDRAPQVTWTLDSRHRWGLAADIAMIRRSTGEAIWSIPSWEWLMKVGGHERFGLRNLAPKEFVHFELAPADWFVERAGDYELIQT